MSFIRFSDSIFVRELIRSHLSSIVIITGGSYLAGTQNSDNTQAETDHALLISKVLRGIGQGVFLAVTILFGLCVLKTMRDLRARGERIHATLKLLAFISCCLCVRGVFGLLQSTVYRVSERMHTYWVKFANLLLQLSYINPVNYDSDGFTTEFSCIEYCLVVLPEFLG